MKETKSHTQRTRWQEIQEIWMNNRWLYFMSGIIFGVILMPAIQLIGNSSEIIHSLTPEAIGIFFTVFIVERLASNRSREELIERLHVDLLSISNDKVISALDRLRYEGRFNPDFLSGKDATRTNWTNAFIGGINFQNSRLHEAIFDNVTNIEIGEVDSLEYWIRADFRKSSLAGASFKKAQISECDFRHCHANSAKFNNADMTDTRFEYAQLNRCDFSNTDLYGTIFEYANLKESNFSSTFLQHAFFTGANLLRATFDDAVISEAITLPTGEETSNISDFERFTNIKHPDFERTLVQVNEIRRKHGQEKIEVPLWWMKK